MKGATIKVDTMRRIDRWVGIPLCALTTMLLQMGWWARPIPPRAVRRILFIELSEMGSTILADPAMRMARARLKAELYFVIFAQNADALKLSHTISSANVFTIRATSMWPLFLDTIAFLFWTRRNQIDTTVDLELFSRFTALLTGLSGANRRVGFYRFHNEGLSRGEMLTHRVAYNPHIHIAKNFIALIEALLSEKPTTPYAKVIIGDEKLTISLPSPSESKRELVSSRIKALFPSFDLAQRRLVLINPNASELLPQRRWMPELFVELIQRIIATYDDTLILITGAASERVEAESLVLRCHSARCVSFAGQSELTDLPALYSLAVVMVSNDSGPAHIAAAGGLPTIVLFGPETPNLYRPLGNSIAIHAGLACSPCVSAANHRKSACDDNVCMRAITVEQVFSAVVNVLGPPAGANVA